MDKLLRAIELSMKATEASREAVQEILRRGAETGIFFSGSPGRLCSAPLLVSRWALALSAVCREDEET